MIGTSKTCVLNMPMNEGTGNPHDSSGYENNGTINGTVSWVNGSYGRALEFNGSGDYVECASDPTLAVTDAFTISVWVKMDAIGVNGGLFSRVPFDAGIGGIWFYQSSGSVVSLDIEAITVVSHSTPPAATWVNVLATYDNSLSTERAKLFYNGIQQNSGNHCGTAGSTTDSTYIGAFLHPAHGFNGLIGEALLYNRALSQTEITDYVTASRVRYGV